MKQLIEVISSASEFENVPIRHGENDLLKALSTEINYKLEKANFNEPNTKTNILLQCHFSRSPLSSDFNYDQKIILEHAIRLCHATVDVVSSSLWLKPAILTMQLCQMVVQALWVTDSPLYQLPFINSRIVQALKQKGVEDIADFMNMEDEERLAVLAMDEKQVAEIAKACNRYPSVSLSFDVQDSEAIVTGEDMSIAIQLQREGDPDDYTDYVYAP